MSASINGSRAAAQRRDQVVKKAGKKLERPHGATDTASSNREGTPGGESEHQHHIMPTRESDAPFDPVTYHDHNPTAQPSPNTTPTKASHGADNYNYSNPAIISPSPQFWWVRRGSFPSSVSPSLMPPPILAAAVGTTGSATSTPSEPMMDLWTAGDLPTCPSTPASDSGSSTCTGTPLPSGAVSESSFALTATSAAASSQVESRRGDKDVEPGGLREAPIRCRRCRAHSTSIWRVDQAGNPVCSACSVLLQLSAESDARAAPLGDGAAAPLVVESVEFSDAAEADAEDEGDDEDERPAVRRSSSTATRLAWPKMRVGVCDSCRYAKTSGRVGEARGACQCARVRYDPSGQYKVPFKLPAKPASDQGFTAPSSRHLLRAASANIASVPITMDLDSPGYHNSLSACKPTSIHSWPTRPSKPSSPRRASPPRPRGRGYHHPARAASDIDPDDIKLFSSDEHTAGESSSSEDSTGCEQRKREIVNNVMRFFVRWLDGRLGIVRQAAGYGSSAASGSSSTPHDESSSASGLLSSGSGGRKHGREEGGGGGGGGDETDEDGGGLSPPNKKRKDSDADDAGEKMKFACPYYKHNPRKYKHQRPCCGPGWDFVHRIKEHLYRKHSLPKFTCHRCCEPFDVEEDLQLHARAATPCAVREPEPLDGFTQDQEKRLRSRKKRPGEEMTEPEKWRAMYRILFPDVAESEIPSPYYASDTPAQTNLRGYEDYLRRELPPMVRRRLEQEVEREFNFMEEGLKRRVVDIVRNLQLALFRGYQQLGSEDLQAAVSAGGTRSSSSVDADGEMEMENAGRWLQTPAASSLASPSAPGGRDVAVNYVGQMPAVTAGWTPAAEEIQDPLGLLNNDDDDDDYNFFGDDEFDFSQFVDESGYSAKVSDSGYSTNGNEWERQGR